jgi:hypothetical protein
LQAPFLNYARHVLTGSYHNYFRIYDTDNLSDVVLQADKSAFKVKKAGPLPGNKGPGAKNGRPLREAMTMDTLDFNKKILHASWHPRENTVAVSCFGLQLHPAADHPVTDRGDEQPLHIQRGLAAHCVPSHRASPSMPAFVAPCDNVFAGGRWMQGQLRTCRRRGC